MESRSVTKTEYQVVQWLLANARTPAGQAYATSLGALHVVDQCKCGCVSVDFEANGKAVGEVIADAVAAWPDGSQAGVMLWGCKGRITGLEVYDRTPDAAKRLPTLAVLRTWEQIGEEMKCS